MRTRNILLLYFLSSLFPFISQGQDISKESLFTDIYTLSPEKEGTVEISLDNLSFLKNNEYEGGNILSGYTLPGVRLNPHVIYYTSPIVKLEAGISLLKYWGANKYPNHTYLGIADWKADDYQKGFHFLPTFRVQIQPTPQFNIIMGNLYGGSNHQLIEPVYYPELNLTADPEFGVQFLYDSKIVHLDTWLNWESFIFRNDTHGEAFTVGVSTCFRVTKPQAPFYLEIPIQALVKHHGGELHQTHGEILIHVNSFTGLRWGYNPAKSSFSKIEINVLGGGFTSRATETYKLPFTRGWAFYSNIRAWIKDFQIQLSYWRSNDFVNILGNPIFQNVSNSILYPNRTFPCLTILQPGIKYERKIDKGTYLGADLDFFYTPHLIAHESDNSIADIHSSMSFTFGLCLRINPSIVLKK